MRQTSLEIPVKDRLVIRGKLLSLSLLLVLLDRVGITKYRIARSIPSLKGVVHHAFDERFRASNVLFLPSCCTVINSLSSCASRVFMPLAPLGRPPGLPDCPFLNLFSGSFWYRRLASLAWASAFSRPVRGHLIELRARLDVNSDIAGGDLPTTNNQINVEGV